MRFTIAGAALFASALVLYAAWRLGFNNSAGALLLNLGTEIIGITLTVAIVDALLTRRAEHEEAQRIATNVLHEIDHAVWVWKGGSRGFDLTELKALLDQISDDDPLPSFTQNLIMALASKSANTLRQRSSMMKKEASLKNALAYLSPLEKVRDSYAKRFSPTEIASCLTHAIDDLIAVSKIVGSTKFSEVLYSDSSIEMQIWRHYGDLPNSEAKPKILT